MTEAFQKYLKVFKDDTIKILSAIALISTIVARVATALAVDILKLKGFREANPLYYSLGSPLFYIVTTLATILLVIATPIVEKFMEMIAYVLRKVAYYKNYTRNDIAEALRVMRIRQIYLGLIALLCALDAVHDLLSFLLITSPKIGIVTVVTFTLLRNPLAMGMLSGLYVAVCMFTLYKRYKKTLGQGKTKIVKISL
ncbi:MAG: hypothetical protein DRJ52_11215 [Thermoprotei archaeon]|nr:MAG: hypothetical protein DRJ52_11215 [Thermoprotei archaeon]